MWCMSCKLPGTIEMEDTCELLSCGHIYLQMYALT